MKVRLFPLYRTTLAFTGTPEAYFQNVTERINRNKNLSNFENKLEYLFFEPSCNYNENTFFITVKNESIAVRLSFHPRLKGSIVQKSKDGFTAKIKIAPYVGGIITFLTGSVVCILVAYENILNHKYISAIPPICLILVLYIGMTFLFNRTKNQYLNILLQES